MANKQSKKLITITGIENLIKQGVRHNKRTVTIPKANWELIEMIINKVRLEVPNE